MRIVEKAASDCNLVGLIFREDIFGLLRLRDQADCTRCNSRFAPDFLRKRCVIVDVVRRAHIEVDAARGRTDEIEALGLQRAAEFHAVLDAPAVLYPIGC